MKRKKLIGVVLFTATFIYLFAFVLSLYQNQRVQFEKEMSETLKLYSQTESSNVKELSKDMNSLLDEKLDKEDMEQQILQNEGNFARIDKNVTNVTKDMVVLEKNITNLSDLITTVENHFNNLNEKVYKIDNYLNTIDEKIHQMEESYYQIFEEIKVLKTTMESDILLNKKAIQEIQIQLKDINQQFVQLISTIEENDGKHEENIKLLKEQLSQCEEKITKMEENVLYYQFDEESKTLHVYGNQNG